MPTRPVLPLSRAEVFFDGTLGPIRLKHPEGVAVAGAVWCGGDGGFVLGLAFGVEGRLYACDLGHRGVFRFDPRTGALDRFAGGTGTALRIPNFPVVDADRGVLYVSDSHDPDRAGPGIWRFDLETGAGGLWYDRPLRFANGMALSPDRSVLFVAETFARRVVRIPIGADGAAGTAEPFVAGIERLPDGLAFDAEGALYVACYEPSRIYRTAPDGRLELLIDDPDAHLLCHPTNVAFRGTDLFAANLGRWHVTRIPLEVAGAPLLDR